MMFKNSVKLFIANNSIFWKVFLYKIIALSVCALLALPVLWTWISVFEEAGLNAAFISFSTNTVFSNLTELFENLFVLVQTFIKGLSLIIQTNIFAFIYTIIMVLIVYPFLLNLSSVPAGECLYSYMATLSKQKFSVAFISKLGLSSVYSILRTLLNAVILVLFMGGLYGLLSLTTIGGVLNIVLPFLIFIYFVVGLSLIVTFLSGWLPATVAFNISPALTLKKGLKASFRRFGGIFSAMFFVFFVASWMGLMMTSFSLILIVPFAELLVIMFEMVMFFDSQGNRYYVDLDTICTPKKLETKDSFRKTKSLI